VSQMWSSDLKLHLALHHGCATFELIKKLVAV